MMDSIEVLPQVPSATALPVEHHAVQQTQLQDTKALVFGYDDESEDGK